MELSILQVDLQNPKHCDQMIKLLNDYMNDPMGNNRPMPRELGPQIISGLKKHSGFLGIFVMADDQFAGLANCNINFSTFQAKPLINIHDFIVTPEYRNIGAGSFLLQGIIIYASENGFCRVNLEVREDNPTAKSLYKKNGFSDCVPKMMFWERKL
jgi:ribosomal protein S18 acetylase RimI-like enzyme